MRLHRFFIEDSIDASSTITIQGIGLAHQLHNVFRLKVGDSIIAFDGSGSDYTCTIEDLKKDSVALAVASSALSRFMPRREVSLCAAIVKKDTFEWIVEKATELGVTKIIPIMAERSEKKSLNMERLRKISIEASEQSGRGNVPGIGEIVNLEEAILKASEKGVQAIQPIAFHTEGEPFKSGVLDNSLPVAIFIGPEGGWSSEEIEVFHRNKVPVYCLGGQVLKAETAVVSAFSLVVLGN